MVNYWELLSTPNTKLLLHLNGNSTDSSGNGNNWTDTAITYSSVAGALWQGAGFNGSSSVITIASSASLNVWSSDFTMSMWIYFTSTATYMRIYNKYTSGNGIDFRVDSTNSSKLYCYLEESSASTAVTSAAWCISTWTRLNIIFVRSWTSHTIYRDWKQCWTPTTWTVRNISNSASALLWSYSSSGWFNWKMDEVIIENRAWSSKKISDYYAMTKWVHAPKMI